MSRIKGLERPVSPFKRFVYFMVRRKLGKVVTPVKVHARHDAAFGGYVRMEMAQDKFRRVAPAPKALASIRVATLVGCPF